MTRKKVSDCKIVWKSGLDQKKVERDVLVYMAD